MWYLGFRKRWNSISFKKSNESDSAFNINVGKIVGEEKHKLTIEELASHNHIVKTNDNAARDTIIGVTVPYSYGGGKTETLRKLVGTNHTTIFNLAKLVLDGIEQHRAMKSRLYGFKKI